MKLSQILFVAGASAALCAAGAQNDPIYNFWTYGPDKYADGSLVLKGERYALVWAENDLQSVTFNADGTVVGGAIVEVVRTENDDGSCHRYMFEVDVARMPDFPGGTWCVYLLDTRRWDADGNVSVSDELDIVNAAGIVDGSQVQLKPAGDYRPDKTKLRENPCVASTPSAVPEGTVDPVITDIRIDGEEVCVSATNTVPYIQYTLLSSDAPDADKFGPAESAQRTGSASPKDELQFRVPVSDSGRAFFRVGRAAARE